MNNKCFLALSALGTLLLNVQTLAAVGRTPAQYQVSSTGTAQYQIPIWAPPGPHGVQPNISLNYDSRSVNGPLGIGWSLGGLSSIYRCSKTYAQDTTAGAVTLTSADRFCLDGKRLRLTSSEVLTTYGQAGTTYQTEIADFSNVTAVNTAGTGPSYFTVQRRDGLTFEYGNGGNSQVTFSGNATVVAWYLDKVTDRAGNTMTISYVAPSANLTGYTEPALVSWVPAAHGSTTYDYTMQFTYGTASKPSKTGYVGGSPTVDSTSLSNIEIMSASAVVKKYVLTYGTSPTTGRQRLSTVKECADAAATNCLSPTSIGYQDGTSGVSNPTAATGSTTNTNVAFAADIDGDGKQDLIYAVTSGPNWHYWVKFGTATGFGTAVDTGIVAAQFAPFLIDNFDGTPGNEFLVVVSGAWHLYKWNATTSTFSNTTSGLPAVVSGVFYACADMDGDGRPDLAYAYNAADGSAVYIAAQFNQTTAGVVSFGSASVVGTLPTITAAVGSLAGDNAGFSTPLKRLDFDGDGRSDLLVYISYSRPTHYTRAVEVLSRGTSAPVFSADFPIGGGVGNVFPLNWNDDACTDMAFDVNNGNAILVSECNGATSQLLTLPVSPVVALDWDGDGRTDILGTDGNIYLSTGNGVAAAVPSGFTASPYYFYAALDSNGDGLDDLVFAGSSGAITYGLHKGSTTPPDLATSFTDGYGNFEKPTYASLSDSSNVYGNNNDAVFPYINYVGPLYVVNSTTFSDPSAAVGTTYQLTYQYWWAWMQLQGRGFCGFYSIDTVDSRTPIPGEVYYSGHFWEREFPYTGMLNQDWLYQTNAAQSVFNLMQQTQYTPGLHTLDSASNNQRVFPYEAEALTTTYESGGTEATDLMNTKDTTYTYDNYGNALTVNTIVTDNDPGSPYAGDTWTTAVTNTTDIVTNQTADLAAWCLPLLRETQVVYSASLAGSTGVTRTQTYTPDATAYNCRITTTVTEPTANSGLYKVTENLTFDAFGNIHTDTITGANMPSSPASRLTSNDWGTTGQFLQTQTDPSNATTTWTYGSSESLTFGVPDSVKNASNLTISWLYDEFGRNIKETRPDGTSTAWSWTLCTAFCSFSNSVYQIAQTAYQTNGTTVIRADTVLYDPIDRVTEKSGPTVAGTSVITQTTYTSLGLVNQQSMPFIGATSYQTTFGYDFWKRIATVKRPISSTNSTLQTTSYAYAGRTTIVTDPYSHTKTTVTDVTGALRQTKDALGFKVTRTFDAAGSLTGVTDSAGNTLLSGVTYKYGIQPFRIADSDADRGAWTYTVDSLGEQTAWTDAKTQSFALSYDALSRPLTRTEPDLFTKWTYGSTPANHDFGQLITECTGPATSCDSTGYSETRTYDNTGRLWKRLITQGGNPGNDTGGGFQYTYGYDTNTGFLNSLTYPKSSSSYALNLSYGYQNGLLKTVTDTTDTTAICGSSCTLWTATAMNAFGQITQETLGNGVDTSRSYDAVTSWLTKATATNSGGTTILNQSYLQDENGNVTQRQDNNLGLTESTAYDADNRLTCTALASTCTTSTVAYDAGVAGPGNITSQTGVGTYHYPTPGTARPHAVTSITGSVNGITNPSFSYDANGNMTARASAGQNITWSSYNYPLTIMGSDATGIEEVDFLYGPDRQRWKQTYSLSGTTEFTYYIGGLVDLVFSGGVANYRQYIYAGSEPLAVYSRSASGTNVMSYFLQDHQGSVSAITSNTGTVTVKESFSAFGARRNPGSWSGAPSTGDLNTIAGLSRQGYTFQTALGQSMGLNHMNGRVQDAIIGRFLSADPNVPDSANGQSYNRYAYVNNNPMSRIDPTGFDVECYGTDEDGGTTCVSGPTSGLGTPENPSGVNGPPEGPSPGSTLPDAGCGIAPFGPCYTPDPYFPSPFDTPPSTFSPPVITPPSLPPIKPAPTKPNKSAPVLPQSPKQPDPRCTKQVPHNSTVTGNINYLRQLSYLSQGSNVPSFLSWLTNVAPGGSWDYKTSRQPGSEAMGNFNYGATGSLFFGPTTLLSGAGIVQLLTLPSNSSGGIPFVMPPYGDESGDQQDITAGINGGC